MLRIYNILLLFIVGFLISFLILFTVSGNLSDFQQLCFPTIKIVGDKSLFSVLCGACLEEVLFRGIILFTLYSYFRNEYIAIVIQAILFTGCHLYSYSSLIAFLGYFIGGVYYCFFIFFKKVIIISVSNNQCLSYSVGIHFGWNYYQVLSPKLLDSYNYECSIQSLFCRIIIFLITILFIKVFNRFNRFNI